MEKELVLKRLQNTIDMLCSLREEQFYYGGYVDQNNGQCGTTCCVAGWYPKYFKETNLVWELRNGGGLDLRTTETSIEDTLMHYHGLSRKAINILFYGMRDASFSKLSNDASLQQIRQRFAAMRRLLEKGEGNYEYLL